MSGGPADPWQDEDGIASLVLESGAKVRAIAGILADEGLKPALRAISRLSAEDLVEIAAGAALQEMVDERRRVREREDRRRLCRPWLWRPWRWRPWRRFRRWGRGW